MKFQREHIERERERERRVVLVFGFWGVSTGTEGEWGLHS